MAALLLMLAIGDQLGLGPWEYATRPLLLAAVLWLFSRRHADLRAPHWAGSLMIGVLVFAIWVAPDVLWPGYRQLWIFNNSLTGSPTSSVPEAWRGIPLVIVSRTLRAVLLVPIIEELFWRGWMMRWLVNPDFTRVPLGTYTRSAFWTSAVLFATVHGAYWEVGLVAGVIYNWWMVRTHSLGDCILAHAVTNAILSAYVLGAGKWQYW
jgi:CAAX prenyl protease-like protein